MKLVGALGAAGVELISEGAPSQAAERLTGVKPHARRNR
jgi:hypothetical protein